MNRQSFSIKRWGSWSPDMGNKGCQALSTESIPPLIRRRCSQLSKMMLTVAAQVMQEDNLGYLVFCSQHGDLDCSISLLQALAEQELLSPAAFVRSVHNFNGGLFSIIHQLQQNSNSIASGENSFIMAMIDALAWLNLHPREQVLVVVFDDYIPQQYNSLHISPNHQYAAALLLENNKDNPLSVELGDRGSADKRTIPQALQFLQWLDESNEKSLDQGDQHYAVHWRRDS